MGGGERGERSEVRERSEREGKRGSEERREKREGEGERRERRVWARKGNQGTQKHAISDAFLVFDGKGKREGRWWWSGRMPNTKNAPEAARFWCSREGGAGGEVETCRTCPHVLRVLVRGNTRNTPKQACFSCSRGWGMLGGLIFISEIYIIKKGGITLYVPPVPFPCSLGPPLAVLRVSVTFAQFRAVVIFFSRRCIGCWQRDMSSWWCRFTLAVVS